MIAESNRLRFNLVADLLSKVARGDSMLMSPVGHQWRQLLLKL
jgi:hypothetical protein